MPQQAHFGPLSIACVHVTITSPQILLCRRLDAALILQGSARDLDGLHCGSNPADKWVIELRSRRCSSAAPRFSIAPRTATWNGMLSEVNRVYSFTRT
eukprot:19580-Amphidinium_carterae.1